MRLRSSVCSGIGIILSHASVMIASVPSLPHMRRTRSYPALFFGRGSPNFATEPSERTTFRARVQSFTVPYLKHFIPPEFSATAPPTVHQGALEGSGGKKNPFFLSSSFRPSSVIPGSQWTYQFTVSIFKIRFILFEKSMTIPPCEEEAPVRLVPAPLATTGVLVFLAYSTIFETSSVEFG